MTPADLTALCAAAGLRVEVVQSPTVGVLWAYAGPVTIETTPSGARILGRGWQTHTLTDTIEAARAYLAQRRDQHTAEAARWAAAIIEVP